MDLDEIDLQFNEEDVEMTTLSVPKVFRKHLKDNYDGHNDFERLEKWASDFSEEQAEMAVAEYLKSEMFEDQVIGIIRNQLVTYNTDFREDLEEAIEETVRDMQRGR